MRHLVTAPAASLAFERFPQLLENPFVNLPIHNNVPRFNDRVIAPLGELAAEFADYLLEDKAYPNACMHLAPTPSDQFDNRITFMVAWGKQVDRLPHPRCEMLPEYFGRAALRSMKLRRKIHIKSVMDGHGILGKIRINRSDNVELGVYMRSSASSQVVEKSYSNLIDIRGTVLDVISELKLNQPLRFHSGIRYIAKNSYISNEFFADDQQNAIPLTA